MVAASRQHKWINLFAQRGQRSNRPAWLRSSPGDAFSCWGDRRGYAVSGKNFSSSLSLAPRARFEAASTVTRSHLPLGTKCLQGETRGEVAVALSCRNDHARTLCRKEDSEKAEQHRLRDRGIGGCVYCSRFRVGRLGEGRRFVPWPIIGLHRDDPGISAAPVCGRSFLLGRDRRPPLLLLHLQEGAVQFRLGDLPFKLREFGVGQGVLGEWIGSFSGVRQATGHFLRRSTTRREPRQAGKSVRASRRTAALQETG